jgi:anti-sigma factor RsiW
MNAHDHEQVRAYVDGELSPSECEALRRRAAADLGLQAELDSQQALRTLLTGLPPPPVPAPIEAPVPVWRQWLARLRGFEFKLGPLAAMTAGFALFVSGLVVGAHRPAPSADRVPVRFVFMGDAREVFVAGTFNGWSQKAQPLEPIGDGIWEATVELPRGEHRYLFRVDGRWQEDSLATQAVPDGMGHMDAVLRL